jgi:hypothetical protein
MTMLRKESAGDYQIGIWSVRREGRRWLAQATGPGTLGDGSPHYYPTLAAAYLAMTGEATTPNPWAYKGVIVHPADRNSSGIRWYARIGSGRALRADSKDGMRDLITLHLGW